jgi:hypothetical protein
VRGIPELPAGDIGTTRFVPRKKPGFGFLGGQVLHDGARLGEHEIAVHERWYRAVRVKSEVFGALVLALRKIELLLLELDAENRGGESNTPNVGRQRVEIELHGGPPRRLGGASAPLMSRRAPPQVLW